MDRRRFLESSLALGIAGTWAAKAFGQTVEDEIPIEWLRQLSANLTFRDRVFVDVAFIQSWRVEFAPTGYEDEAWGNRASQNRREVWDRLSAAGPTVFDVNLGVLGEYNKVLAERLEENRDRYTEFMNEIGIPPDGKAGMRIGQSLYWFALLNAAVFGSDVEQVDDGTYFWPFC